MMLSRIHCLLFLTFSLLVAVAHGQRQQPRQRTAPHPQQRYGRAARANHRKTSSGPLSFADQVGSRRILWKPWWMRSLAVNIARTLYVGIIWLFGIPADSMNCVWNGNLVRSGGALLMWW